MDNSNYYMLTNPIIDRENNIQQLPNWYEYQNNVANLHDITPWMNNYEKVLSNKIRDIIYSSVDPFKYFGLDNDKNDKKDKKDKKEKILLKSKITKKKKIEEIKPQISYNDIQKLIQEYITNNIRIEFKAMKTEYNGTRYAVALYDKDKEISRTTMCIYL